jgi:hypothetical protein
VSVESPGMNYFASLLLDRFEIEEFGVWNVDSCFFLKFSNGRLKRRFVWFELAFRDGPDSFVSICEARAPWVCDEDLEEFFLPSYIKRPALCLLAIECLLGDSCLRLSEGEKRDWQLRLSLGAT